MLAGFLRLRKLTKGRQGWEKNDHQWNRANQKEKKKGTPFSGIDVSQIKITVEAETFSVNKTMDTNSELETEQD